MNVSSFLNRQQTVLRSAMRRLTARRGILSGSVRGHRFRSLSLPVVGVCSSVLIACSGDDIAQLPSAPDAERIWIVRFDTRAIALAKGTTYQLSATPLNARNEPVADASPIRFRSLNLDCVSVDSTGMMTALLATSSAPVLAELTMNGVTYVDTVSVYVTDSAYVAKSIVFRDWFKVPIPTQIDLGAWLSFQSEVLDSLGNVIPGLTPAVVSSNSRILNAGPTYATAFDIGKAKLRASIVAYGRRLTDSTEITVRIPSNLTLYLGLPPQGTYFIATGGKITWNNYWSVGKPVNITFQENSPAIVGGNVEQIARYGSASRTFTAPGTYHFRDTLNNTSGAVLVRDQPVH